MSEVRMRRALAKKSMGRLAVLGLVVFGMLSLSGCQSSPASPEISSQVLIDKASVTVLGEPLIYPTSGTPEISASKITLPPGATTGLHFHEAPLVAYILSGELTVEYADGQSKIYPAGSAVIEALNSIHIGTNEGSAPVELIAFNIGSSTVRNTVPVK